MGKGPCVRRAAPLLCPALRLHAVLSLSLMCFRRHHAGGLAAGQESPGHVHHRCQVTLSDASVWLLVEPRQLLPLLCLSGYS